MDKQFEIKAQDKAVRFHSPQFNDDGWLDQYRLTFQSPDLNMSIPVDNPPYGTSPAEFFKELADHWSGWQGEKSWGAMEGEFSIKATMSKTGHASICFTANIYYSPGEWLAIASFDVEAGQLERLEKEAKRFFNRERL